VKASNGVAHLIDSVLLPPAEVAPTDEPTAAAKTLLEIVAATSDLSTLATAATTAGLADVLKSAGTLTVFAPTNAAFDKLPAGTLASLLANPDQLAEIVKYHVFTAAAIMSTDLKPGAQTISMANGADLTVTVADGSVTLSDGNGKYLGKVITADVKASNGVAHLIDSVLLPPVTDGATTVSPSSRDTNIGSPGENAANVGSDDDENDATLVVVVVIVALLVVAAVVGALFFKSRRGTSALSNDKGASASFDNPMYESSVQVPTSGPAAGSEC